ncbi:prepilin-type N-terminal cleavage/methylation domain-containing protein [Rubritalea marina]|uniref:prepilin-type N-terminal cleavage/methylation domain-containing protein n=1 Tax=Rubritalea marina TaxID=361055 RepID=UPI00036C0B8D|nr:type II secretion system protein [Rubritalea marina]
MMKISKKRKGYTLIELTVVMVLVMLIATATLGLFQQQIQFLNWWNTQKFIGEDAPFANSMIVRVFSKADEFKIYADQATALGGTGVGTTAGGAVIMLGFSQADGSKDYGLIAYDAANDRVDFHVLNATATGIDSSWTIVSGVANASFDVVGGVMQLQLTGSYGGQVTYAANPSL